MSDVVVSAGIKGNSRPQATYILVDCKQNSVCTCKCLTVGSLKQSMCMCIYVCVYHVFLIEIGNNEILQYSLL